MDKVCIVDNGRDYSDHTISFVLVPEGKQPELDRAIAILSAKESYGKTHVVAVVSVDEWRTTELTPMSFDGMMLDLQNSLEMYLDD